MTKPQLLFVSLRPEPELEASIRRAKSCLIDAVGQQLYVDDPPHLTLYLAMFGELGPAIAAADRLARELSAPGLEISGWHTFFDDPLTACHTLVAQFAHKGEAMLRSVQRRVLQAIAPLREVNATLEHFSARRQALSQLRWSAVEAHGFPYVGDDWHPHFTIAAIRPECWQAAWSALRPFEIRGCYQCDALELYRLEGSIPVKVSGHAMQQPE